MPLIFLRNTKLLVHDVYTVAVIAFGILDQKEVTLFILEVDVIGIIGGNAFFMHEHCAFIPMRAVLGGIEDKALEDNGINHGREFNLLTRCKCTKDICHWEDGCGEYWYQKEDGT